jgi:hypothetical protein
MDLDPISVQEQGTVAWLEARVWPDEGDRLKLLRQALNVARRDPQKLGAGICVLIFERLRVTSLATLVIFHTAVLAYVSRDERLALAQTIRRLKAV